MRPFQAARALDAIDLLGSKDAPTQIVVEDIVHRVVEVVEVEAFFVGATDPNSGLCLGAGMVYNMSPEICHPFWEHEFLVPDFNKFIHLSPTQPVADLREATGDKLSRSPRYRALNQISDLEDELRAVLHAGACTWGILQLNRKQGGRPFDAAERRFLSDVAPLAGRALRRALLTESAAPIAQRAIGMLILGPDGKVVDATQEAEEWLEDVAAGWRIYDDSLLHPELLNLALAMSGKDQAPRRATLRTTHGVWLTVQVSALSESDNVAMVLQPAKASEILPLLLKAYGLSKREAEIAQLISKGLTTQEIAERLFLSQHTVRDHVKAIFEKVQVSSRGELTSKLFFEQNFPELEKAVLESFNRP
jgi:DNA-binding CsgD family transcriptional regulator